MDSWVSRHVYIHRLDLSECLTASLASVTGHNSNQQCTSMHIASSTCNNWDYNAPLHMHKSLCNVYSTQVDMCTVHKSMCTVHKSRREMNHYHVIHKRFKYLHLIFESWGNPSAGYACSNSLWLEYRTCN